LERELSHVERLGLLATIKKLQLLCQVSLIYGTQKSDFDNLQYNKACFVLSTVLTLSLPLSA